MQVSHARDLLARSRVSRPASSGTSAPAAGDGGRSVESGAAIPDAHLGAIPGAERTVEEQAASDRLG